ncbi:MAG TPA: DUF4384 domain-containing protein [Thermoguttaceae bacterium]|nr:DUF4384 domain-containing protein [Thermoguttaceae bacterium]
MLRASLLLSVLLGWVVPGLLGASEPLSREQLRDGIDADGRVIDPELRQRTGWQVVRGLSWRIEREDPWQPGKFVPVEAHETFHSGQRFRFEIEAFSNTFVYVVVANADGSQDVLLPEPDEQTPRLAKGEKRLLPSDGTAFRFQPPGGTHTLRLIASPGKLPWRESATLLKLQNGQQLPGPGEPAPGTARSVARVPSIPQVKGLKAAVRKIDEGSLAKGVTVELVEPTAEGNLVTLTSADPTSKPILVHDVALKQAD